jgi:hypothetical protein
LCDLPMEVAKAPVGNVKGGFPIQYIASENGRLT